MDTDAEMPDRPPQLSRRRPRPAADDGIDPVEYRPPAVGAAPTSVDQRPAADPAPAHLVMAVDRPRRPGRPRREPTVSLGHRVSLRVGELLDDLVDSTGLTYRDVLEDAIRAYHQHRADG